MAVSAVWRRVYFLAPCQSESKEQTAAHRRDALCPSTFLSLTCIECSQRFFYNFTCRGIKTTPHFLLHPRLHLRCERYIHAKNLMIAPKNIKIWPCLGWCRPPRPPTRDWRQSGAFHSNTRILNSSLILIQRNEAPHSDGTICQINRRLAAKLFGRLGIQNPDTDEDANQLFVRICGISCGKGRSLKGIISPCWRKVIKSLRSTARAVS